MAKKGKSTSPPNAALPAAPKTGKPSALLDTRVVYCGDNLEQLAKLPDACVDLIYIDPPFNSNRNYEVFWGETKEKRSFEDRHASTQAYIDYMRPRCVQLARVLKKTGSFYYHCDWHASHYVKVMLDAIFGENNFQNEIVWKRGHAQNTAGRYGNSHDTILFYDGSESHTWNGGFHTYDDEYVAKHYRHVDGSGRPYKHENPTGAGIRNGATGQPWRGIDPTAKGRHWCKPPEELEEMDRQGLIYWPEKAGAWPYIKVYLENMKGIPLQSIWTDIDVINMQAQERLGYPTQKPLALLDRIIKASSNPNDIILDAFCGCGTALVAAQNLGRQWIGIDISPTACRVMAKRLRDVCNMKESEPRWKAHQTDAFVVRDLPWTVDKLRALPHFEFENWAVIALGGIPNKVQVGDMGVDGRIFPVGTKPSEGGLFSDDWFPIQVKQMDKVGRPDIDAFEAVMEREGQGGRQRGFFVSFGYTKDAEAECAAFHKRTGRIIKLLTVQEILDEEHVQKM
jgi:DNA modification methylase